MKNSGRWLLGTGVVLIVTILIGVNVWHDRKYVSADVTVVDTNNRALLYESFCIGLRSLSRQNYEMKRCGITNGNTIVGQVDRGDYELRVWLGDMEVINHLLYTQPTQLTEKEQPIYVVLPNVKQSIGVFFAEKGITIPRDDYNSIVLQKYSSQ